ncbi:MAG: S-layer homology domain-containing protein [Clostridia bacterium]
MKKLLVVFVASALLTTLAIAEEKNVEYAIESEISDGNFIISEMVSVKTLEYEPSTGGANIDVKKYGVADADGNVLIEPILDFTSLYGQSFEIIFDENGFSAQNYDAEYYYYGGQQYLWRPSEKSENILISESYNTWKDYDMFYTNFVTDNRYIVKDDGISYMVDRDLKIITGDYTHIIELDDGKWYASTDSSQTAPVYSIVLDNNANVLTNFDPELEKISSEWAESYISKAEELNIITQAKTTAFNASFFTKEITRNEFCRLAVNMLNAMNYVVEDAENNISYIDTQDENVLFLSNLGVINGVGDNKFDPYSNITREQAAKILINLANLLQYNTSAKSEIGRFSDIENTSSWATDFVLGISALKTQNGESVMGGTSDTTFSPLDTYTVEQAVTTLVRMVEVNGIENP